MAWAPFPTLHPIPQPWQPAWRATRPGWLPESARQAARQLAAVLEEKRAILAAAETEVATAKREVVRVVAEAIAIRGEEAERVHHRAKVASNIVHGILQAGTTGYQPQVLPTTAKLGAGGGMGMPAVGSDAERQEHTALWSDLMRRLDGDASAAL
ncbi:hypothetical protein FF100_22355 [Methylobacterium terricola]|uniref:Uncharacterized protein n=1 Tax=Methylobacterium terricola TaxID=2583531 RepID=A0A5C4LD09_9HYPH|nr:hypothetical protein [Methylobacterium terricola]TNC10417.1 hypothetical protein FF100_22355 [Methylobacterium terricola]